MSDTGYRLPQQQTYENAVKFLLWNQFPLILDRQVRYYAALPMTGIYRRVNPGVKSFMDALNETNSREITLSGIGSLIDDEKYGHNLKRPSPQLATAGCAANSLCIEPTCFCFTEGVIENTNQLRNMCWSLNMPCLKDMYYADAQFERKIKQYFAMFFKQGPAVLEAYQRTKLLKEAIKIVATNKNITFTGGIVGSNTISLPFYMNPTDPTAFPDLADLPAGVGVGGANLAAFSNFIIPRAFSGTLGDGVEGYQIYGLTQDYTVALDQTASVMDSYMSQQIIASIRMMGGTVGTDRVKEMIGDIIHDGLFPTFGFGANGTQLVPVTQEIQEPATIAGYIQTTNPAHGLQKYRGLLFVPNNWRFDLVEPPKDNFSDLGVGEGLNFAANTPGVFPLMSTSMFRDNQVGPDGTVIIGEAPGQYGFSRPTARGLVPRPQPIAEAVRTQLIQTYSPLTCDANAEGQLSNVGPKFVQQGSADGFALKSTMYIATAVYNIARPLLLIFQTNIPRSAQPINVCDVEEIEITTEGGCVITNCCQFGTGVALTFTGCDPAASFTAEDNVIYRTGARGSTYLATVLSVAGQLVAIEPQEEGATLPCCTGPDNYGALGTLTSYESITELCGEVMKAKYDPDTGNIFIELFNPILPSIDGTAGTLTLDNGDVIVVETVGEADNVFLQLTAGYEETCDFSTLDCSCLMNAVFCITT